MEGQWGTSGEYCSVASKPYTFEKIIVDNNENAVNVMDNNNISELNNIGGHISGAQTADHRQSRPLTADSEPNMFRTSERSLEDLNHNDYEEEEEEDGPPRDYSDDFDIDEDYEREGEYSDESEDEDDLLANAGATTVFGLTELDRSLGEVYTIPEEEEDLVSPQMSCQKNEYKLATVDNDLNSDTAATLHRWRGNSYELYADISSTLALFL